MRCWKSLLSLAFALLLTVAGSARAAGIEVKQASLLPGDDAYELSADFAIELPPTLDEAVSHGLTLYFVAEFELNRPRWYWFDERASRQTQTWRLSYHALTRQYRLASGALHQSFTSLNDALRVLARIRNWQVVERKDVRPGEGYLAQLRLYLDLSQLPKPFQLNAIANRDWDLSSPRHTFNFMPSAGPAAGEGK